MVNHLGHMEPKAKINLHGVSFLRNDKGGNILFIYFFVIIDKCQNMPVAKSTWQDHHFKNIPIYLFNSALQKT